MLGIILWIILLLLIKYPLKDSKNNFFELFFIATSSVAFPTYL